MSREPIRRVARLLAPLALATTLLSVAAGPVPAGTPSTTATPPAEPKPTRFLTLDEGHVLVVLAATDPDGRRVPLRHVTRDAVGPLAPGQPLHAGVVMTTGERTVTLSVLTDRGPSSFELAPGEALSLAAWGRPTLPDALQPDPDGRARPHIAGCRCSMTSGPLSDHDALVAGSAAIRDCRLLEGTAGSFRQGEPAPSGRYSRCVRALFPAPRG